MQEKGKTGAVIYTSDNFMVVEEDHYICETVAGRVSIEESHAVTNLIMESAERSGCRNLLLNVQELSWISDLRVRRGAIGMVAQARHLFDGVAIVSTHKAVRSMVVAMFRGGGIGNTKAFSSENVALPWLIGTDDKIK